MWMDEAQCMVTLFHPTLTLAPSSQAHLCPLPTFSPSPYLPNPQFHSNKEDALGNVTYNRRSKIPCTPLEKSHVLLIL
jgi:hypothetical protein